MKTEQNALDPDKILKLYDEAGQNHVLLSMALGPARTARASCARLIVERLKAVGATLDARRAAVTK